MQNGVRNVFTKYVYKTLHSRYNVLLTYITIAYALTIPINYVVEQATELVNVADLDPRHALVLVIVSVSLTLLGGMIPASMAAKKDPVEALRSE